MINHSNKLSVCMISSGFPVLKGDNSGIFIKKLVDHFREEINLKILVPSHREKFSILSKSFTLIRVKYFFRRWENLFYSARGLPQEIIHNPLILWKFPFFIASMTLYTLKHSKNVNLIHAHWLPMGLFCILPKILWGKPVVITIRGSDVNRMNYHRIDKFIASIVFKFCDVAVVVSKSFERQLNSKYPFLKVVYIPNGIDVISTNQILKGNKNEAFTILYVGNLVQEKGLLDLKWAIEKLLEKELKVNITFIGNGDLKKIIVEWSIKYPDRIFVMGTIPHENVISIMRRSDILVLPSYSEGRPNVVVEAMANYLPVLGTNISGISEIIENGKSGLLFSPGDKEELYNLLESCIKGCVPLVEYAKNAFEWIKKEGYSWRQTADAYSKLYQSLI